LPHRPIESCGVIGDLHSVALVAMDGSIDWCCLPRFDSPSLFAAILDHDKGGFFRIAPVHAGGNRQMYLPETNVLLTRFLRKEGVGEVVDFMPVHEEGVSSRPEKVHEIVRIVRAVRGSVTFRLECLPAFDYARRPHSFSPVPGGLVFTSGPERVALLSDIPLRVEDNRVLADFTLGPGESASFALRYVEGRDDRELRAPINCNQLLDETVRYWRRWLDHCTYQGRWREKIIRSALVLKLLTYRPTGAIVAAPTCSLPEEIGGERNWDYRYTWIRDAAFTVYAFLRIGFHEEAAAFMDWVEQRVKEVEDVNGPLNIMYGIDGRHELTEETLSHLSGYRNSRPVRIGNGAYNQLQLDIYGEVIDSIYLFDKYSTPVSYSLWRHLRRMLDWVARNWELPDEGIWEVRSGRQHFVYSKLQCWVALDRGLRIADARSLPLERDRIQRERDRIYEAIMERGWDRDRGSFVQSFESKSLDASNLMMPLVHFISPKDKRMISTLDRIMETLVSDSLVYRYQLEGVDSTDDGLRGEEGTFSMCTFWLVEALTRAGRVDEARFIFEKMLTYSNHLGLYSEEIGPTGEALGNFPQAFTHLGLISAAVNLDRTLGTMYSSR
jgi:GH15 family glucan-1,4-alpha-glucosidase